MARDFLFHSSKPVTEFSDGWKQTSWIISVEEETLSWDNPFSENDFITVLCATALPLLQNNVLQYNQLWRPWDTKDFKIHSS